MVSLTHKRLVGLFFCFPLGTPPTQSPLAVSSISMKSSTNFNKRDIPRNVSRHSKKSNPVIVDSQAVTNVKHHIYANRCWHPKSPAYVNQRNRTCFFIQAFPKKSTSLPLDVLNSCHYFHTDPLLPSFYSIFLVWLS